MPNGRFDLDVDAEEKKILAFFQLRTVLSAYARSVLTANLFDPRLGEKPDWYDTVVGHLAATQAQLQRWFDGVAPPTTALPQAYVNFANAYSGQLPNLLETLRHLIAGGDQASSKDIQAVTAIVNELLKIARAQNAAVLQQGSELRTYLGALDLAIKGLTDGAATVNSAIQIEKQAVLDTTDAIAGLQAQLQTDIRAVIGSSVTTFIGLVGLVVAIVIAVADPTAAPIAGAVVAGLVMAGGAIATGLMADSVVKDQEAILNKQAQLTAESQQVVILNGLALTLKGLVLTYEDPAFDPDALASTWHTMALNLEALRDTIIAERTDADGLKELVADLQGLDAMLERLQQFATRLQEAALSGDRTPIQTLTIPIKSAA